MTGPDTDSPTLVSAEWLGEHLDRFRSEDAEYRLLEVSIDPDQYETEHIPGAKNVDWQADLQDEATFDVVSPEDFAALLEGLGITRQTTVVLYGDFYNWFAAHAYWLFSYYCHPDVRLLDGGRLYWLENGYETTTAQPAVPSVEYEIPPVDPTIRSDRDEVEAAIDTETTILDVRAPPEYRGEILSPPGWEEGVQRGGHVPDAINRPWSRAVGADGLYKSPEELEATYAEVVDNPADTIVYCRIGERAAHTWVALHELLGIDAVSHYYGSWVEWGNSVGLPVEKVSSAEFR